MTLSLNIEPESYYYMMAREKYKSAICGYCGLKISTADYVADRIDGWPFNEEIELIRLRIMKLKRKIETERCFVAISKEDACELEIGILDLVTARRWNNRGEIEAFTYPTERLSQGTMVIFYNPYLVKDLDEFREYYNRLPKSYKFTVSLWDRHAIFFGREEAWIYENVKNFNSILRKM